jgi:alpha-D-xyloside xylohydrolase
MVTAKPDPNVAVQLSEQNGVVVLKTARLTVDVAEATGAVSVFDAAGKPLLAERDQRRMEPEQIAGETFYTVSQEFNPGSDEGFYGLGQHQNGYVNSSGQDVELRQHNMNIAIPLVVSSRNYGVLWDNNSQTQFGRGNYGALADSLTLTDADGKPGGLTATYTVDDKPAATRDEGDINYQFFSDLQRWPSFDPTHADRVSDSAYKATPEVAKLAKGEKVVWQGQIASTKTGNHKFKLYVSSYAKVYVDGKLIIDAWRQNWNPWFRDFDVAMTAGVPQSLRVEWVPNDGFIRLLHADPLPADERNELAFTSNTAKAIDYYVIGADSMDGVIGGYRQITGKSVLLPRWAFGYWQSRDRYNTQQELLDTVQQYRAQNLPLDTIVQDWRYWKDDAWGSHVFEKSRYPDPAGMVKRVHDLHARIMVSVWPKFYATTQNYQELAAVNGVYLGNVEAGHKDWVCCVSTYYDPYNQQADDIYWRQIKENLDVLGIDAWWLDNDEPDIRSNVDLAEYTRIMDPTAIGPAAEYFNTFPLMHACGFYDHWHQAHPDTRAFIFSRSAYGGIQRCATAVWSGDLAARWSDLKAQVAAGVGMSMSGIANWTFDIGGYVVEDRFAVHPTAAAVDEYRELYTRWYEMGAFVPIFRSHGHTGKDEGPSREIYSISPPGTEIYNILAWYDRLRYRLMPYIYTLAGDVYHHDYTMMRGLVMDFPNDPKVASLNDEYMFGPAFLVAPVAEYKAKSRSVYLPAGVRWYDFHTGRTFDGGQSIIAEAPLGRLPLFVKAGAIVPVGPAIQYTGEKPDAPILLTVYTGADGRFTLYEDDGVSNAYERGAWSRIPFSYDDATGTLTIGDRGGSFPGMVEHRTFRIRFVTGLSAKALDFDGIGERSVSYTGQSVTVSRSDKAK